MWIIFVLGLFIAGIMTKNPEAITASAIFAVAFSIEGLTIQIRKYIEQKTKTNNSEESA